MSKLFFLITALFAAFIHEINGQSFQAAYIVQANGDTVKGFIEYKHWDRSPLETSFKKSLEGAAIRYKPLQISAFSVANENYEGVIVDIDVSPHRLAELSYSPSPDLVKDTVFLQILVQGEKTLLHLKDRNAKNHFYIKEDGGYRPLIYKQYYVAGGQTGKAVAVNDGYRKILTNYLQDCSSIDNRIKNAKYDVAALTKLFTYYYECSNQQMKYDVERKEGRVELGVVAGATVSSLNFSGDIDYLVNNDYDVSINPTVGVFCDLKILRSNNWSISNDIMYTSFNVKGEGSGGNGVSEYATQASFNYHYIKTHHLLQINLLKKHIVFLSVGLSTGFAIKRNYDIVLHYEGGGPSKRTFASRNFETGYLGGLGFRLGKWNAEARYEFSTGISNYSNVEEQTSRIHVLVKYRLK